MKRDVRNIKEVLRQSWSSASQEQIDVASNRVLNQLRSRPDAEVVEPVEDSTSIGNFGFRRIGIVSAAAALLLFVIAGAVIVRQRHAPPAALANGDAIHFGDLVRSNDNVGMVLNLSDGSRVEMRSQSELSFESAVDGMQIRLKSGGVIVSAAKQRTGQLYVQTKDIIVSVVGTVFLVNAEEEGSRVAVIQGEVRVQQGATEKKLLPGDQVATSPLMKSVPMIKEISWSRNAEAHMALLQQSLALLQQAAIPIQPSQNLTRPSDSPKWEAVSVKPCKSDGGPFFRGGGADVSPGRANWNCQVLLGLVQAGYIMYANPRRPEWMLQEVVRRLSEAGGPGWIRSDRYTINAKAEGTPSYDMMRGPMLQALLEDRFKLKIHWETREIPIYELTAAKGGPKLQPFKEGSCIPFDPDSDVPPNQQPLGPGERSCDAFGRLGRGTADYEGMSLDEFAGTFLTLALRREVINKTGIPGLFNFHLKYANPNLAVSPDLPVGDPVRPTLFTVLEKDLGLKLESTKGPGEFLVVDSVERPTEN